MREAVCFGRAAVCRQLVLPAKTGDYTSLCVVWQRFVFQAALLLMVGLLSWYIRLVCVCIDACTVSGCLKTRNVRGLPRVTRKPAPAPLPKPPTPKWHPPFRAGRKHRTLFPLPPSAVPLFPVVLRRRIRRV